MAIRWDKFTVKSQEAIQSAGTLATEHGNPELLPLHLLAALLEDKEGIIVPVLQKVGVATDQLIAKTTEALSKLPKVSGSGAQPGMSNAMQKVLDRHSRKPTISRTSTSRPSTCSLPSRSRKTMARSSC